MSKANTFINTVVVTFFAYNLGQNFKTVMKTAKILIFYCDLKKFFHKDSLARRLGSVEHGSNTSFPDSIEERQLKLS